MALSVCGQHQRPVCDLGERVSYLLVGAQLLLRHVPVLYTDCEQTKPSPRKVTEIKCVIVLRDTLIVY